MLWFDSHSFIVEISNCENDVKNPTVNQRQKKKFVKVGKMRIWNILHVSELYTSSWKSGFYVCNI